jgi:hypothetical protein
MAHGSDSQLGKGLRQRHLAMIAIGGVIGAGLFVGSGAVIAEVGPAAFITYALTGVLIIMVMRMLGEMAAADPATGSFADYARKSLGGWAGFSVGWLYWYFWVIVVGFEAVAGAGILQRWVPLPLWLLSLILMVLMTATNLYSVRSYGEFELVRWSKGGHHRAVHRPRYVVRPRLVAGQGHGLFQPHRARWVVPERGWRPVLRRRGRDLFDGRRRDRHDCGSRIRRAREGDRQGHELGGAAGNCLLRRLDLLTRDHLALELRRASACWPGR